MLKNVALMTMLMVNFLIMMKIMKKNVIPEVDKNDTNEHDNTWLVRNEVSMKLTFETLPETLDEKNYNLAVQQERKIYKANIGKEKRQSRSFQKMKWTFFEINQDHVGFDEIDKMFTKPTDSMKYALWLVCRTFIEHWTKPHTPRKICFIMSCPLRFLMQLSIKWYFIYYTRWYNLMIRTLKLRPSTEIALQLQGKFLKFLISVVQHFAFHQISNQHI